MRAALEESLSGASRDDIGTVGLDDDGRLVVPLAGMLPVAPIASLLIE
ncbi:hypothetical protein OHR68_20305 [Spirillospora sp. NBC_00431]